MVASQMRESSTQVEHTQCAFDNEQLRIRPLHFFMDVKHCQDLYPLMVFDHEFLRNIGNSYWKESD